MSILIVSISFNFAHNPPGGWYQQFLPNVNGAVLQDITFLDSLTGWGVSRAPAHIVNTTNGGDNWSISYTHSNAFYRIQFINKDTGYVLSLNQYLRTYNGGLNWTIINLPSNIFAIDMFVLNSDTMWTADSGPTFGGLYRTTNGGTHWTLQFNQGGSGNPEKVYFFNRNIGFITDDGDDIWKTTNSGITWTY